MNALKILSGGAAHGLVMSLQSQFKSQTGLEIEGEFGAVGLMADKLRAGTRADILILTSALIAVLAKEQRVVASSILDIGLVETAVAVRSGDAAVDVHDAASLRKALLSADEIYVPDTKASTAGIHVAKVLGELGIADQVQARLRIFPNGATAMRHLGESKAAQPVGCTQSTEIISTPGVKLSGSLPPGCDLSTMYTAAVATHAADPRHAQILIDWLTASEHAPHRRQAGFIDSRK